MKTSAARPGASFRHTLKIHLVTALACAAATLVACGGGDAAGPAFGSGAGNGAGPLGAGPQSAQAAQQLTASVNAVAPSALSAEEAASLAFMREEEKLARDVYAAMHAQWNLVVFANIGSSEQTHMDAVLLLLTRYGLPDPAAAQAAGVYTDPALQALYNGLLASGRVSLVDALKVGAEIEDVDIRDLRAMRAGADNADLLLVIANLEQGSRNHLRAFHDNLARLGATYVPKYISQADYDAIVNTPKEAGIH